MIVASNIDYTAAVVHDDEMKNDTQHFKGFSTFTYYRAGHLYYRTETGIEFPIPTDETDGATLDATMKSIGLMKWIKRQLKEIGDASIKVEANMV